MKWALLAAAVSVGVWVLFAAAPPSPVLQAVGVEAPFAADSDDFVARPIDGDATATGGSGCDIKGNVSYNRGRRIYHMPGDRDYARTRISPSRGERWFCSEAEARAAGWSRAGR